MTDTRDLAQATAYFADGVHPEGIFGKAPS